MLTIACVLRGGGIYTSEWVATLKKQCERWAPQHRFVCLSDVDVPCERIPLQSSWPGWWAKIEALRLPGPVLFFDLDTLIIGDLTDIVRAAETHPFIMLRDFYRLDGLGSGIMAWRETASHLYNRFAVDADEWQARVGNRGDQGFIEDASHMPDIVRWQDVCPGQITSYKVDQCSDAAPTGARVVCFHGEPKPHNCGGWAQSLWLSGTKPSAGIFSRWIRKTVKLRRRS